MGGAELEEGGGAAGLRQNQIAKGQHQIWPKEENWGR